jgi:hypothetical protein
MNHSNARMAPQPDSHAGTMVQHRGGELKGAPIHFTKVDSLKLRGGGCSFHAHQIGIERCVQCRRGVLFLRDCSDFADQNLGVAAITAWVSRMIAGLTALIRMLANESASIFGPWAAVIDN